MLTIIGMAKPKFICIASRSAPELPSRRLMIDESGCRRPHLGRERFAQVARHLPVDRAAVEKIAGIVSGTILLGLRPHMPETKPPQAISGKDDSSSLKLPNRQPERYTLQNRNVVFVVDDDPAMLRSVARLLRQFGYASLLFSLAAPFVNHSNFEEAFCVALDINFGRRRLRHRVAAPSQGDRQISAGHSMTGNDSVSLHTAALQSDCLAYLTKPFSPKSLREWFDSVSVV